jgi:biotin carboxyl carrier protein
MNYYRHQQQRMLLSLLRRRSTTPHRTNPRGLASINKPITYTSSPVYSSNSTSTELQSLQEKQKSRKYHSTTIDHKEYPMHTLLPFPALSPTMELGTIAKWELSEGDSFSAGSVICSIETDKATMDFEAQDDGIIAKILKQGPNAIDLPIGSPIAVVVEEQDDVAAFADFVLAEETTAGSASGTAAASEPPASSTSSPLSVVGGGTGTSILLPSARFLAESKYVLLVIITFFHVVAGLFCNNSFRFVLFDFSLFVHSSS